MSLDNKPSGFVWLSEDRRRRELDRRADVRGADRRAQAAISSNCAPDNGPKDKAQAPSGTARIPAPKGSEKGVASNKRPDDLTTGSECASLDPQPQTEGSSMITGYTENATRRAFRQAQDRARKRANALDAYVADRQRKLADAQKVEATLAELEQSSPRRRDIVDGLKAAGAELADIRRSSFEDGAGI